MNFPPSPWYVVPLKIVPEDRASEVVDTRDCLDVSLNVSDLMKI